MVVVRRIAVLVPLLLAPGCSPGPAPVHDPVAMSGAIDRTLSPEWQARQAAIQHLLETIQRGVPFEYLVDHVPEAGLEESREAFFGGAAELYRWDFAGPPQGESQPLTLVFRLDEPGFPERAEQRTYRVAQQGGRYRLQRVE